MTSTNDMNSSYASLTRLLTHEISDNENSKMVEKN